MKSEERTFGTPCKIQKKIVAGKYTRARASLARKYTNRIHVYESKGGTTSMKIVN